MKSNFHRLNFQITTKDKIKQTNEENVPQKVEILYLTKFNIPILFNFEST